MEEGREAERKGEWEGGREGMKENDKSQRAHRLEML